MYVKEQRMQMVLVKTVVFMRSKKNLAEAKMSVEMKNSRKGASGKGIKHGCTLLMWQDSI